MEAADPIVDIAREVNLKERVGGPGHDFGPGAWLSRKYERMYEMAESTKVRVTRPLCTAIAGWDVF